MAAAKAGSSASHPISGATTVLMPSMSPAMPAAAPASSQSATITRTGRMPETRARSGSSATARICRPIGVA
jgi:hypothetical protein